jgi:xylulokinase
VFAAVAQILSILGVDIGQESWIQAFQAGCQALSGLLPKVDAVAISGTTPGLTAMDGDGNALHPAILMLDQRSRGQAQQIIDAMGLQRLLEETGNMPVAGGCSLASMLWLKDNRTEVWRKAACFGHSNTFLAKWLTGEFAIDPSSASLTALYDTVANKLTWNADIAKAFGLAPSRLPRLMWAFQSPGRMESRLALELGFKKQPPVVIGGNDAVLAAYSAGVVNPGDVINVNGTCEITLVCLERCLPSTRYHVRAHAIPDRWLTLYVMNAGGKAYEWFKTTICRELSDEQFYQEFVPRAVEQWLDRPNTASYIPYLMGSRYSLEPLRAQFSGLTHESTREGLMAAMVRGLCEYQREHLKDIAVEVPLRDTIYVTGGANIPAVIRAKERWLRACRYECRDQSSMLGAALLGLKHLQGD